MTREPVIVIGGGIAGLTAAALLTFEGVPITLLESHHQFGGCAGTFRRGPFVFDVGATQVAGLEPGGSHERVFRHLGCPLPGAELLELACLIDLLDGSEPIHLWHDAGKWEKERRRQFPGCEAFWSLCDFLHKSNWDFAGRDPVLPARNIWDFAQLLKAIRPMNLGTGLLSTFCVSDLLRICGCAHDKRLRHFLDLQLRLYSQKPAERTAALYGATVLQMAQEPLGLWHLKGSMQKLADHLASCISRDGGKLLTRHRVVGLAGGGHKHPWKVDVISPDERLLQLESRDVVCSLPPQCLLKLIQPGAGLPDSYRKRLELLPKPSGAIVFYGAVDRALLPENCPAHIQLAVTDPGALFISISREGDGRAPKGTATLIASVFTKTADWCFLSKPEYKKQKHLTLIKIMSELEKYFDFDSKGWLHKELATPKSFSHWTGRPEGIVGGLGQDPGIFGLFGLPSRTPTAGLWLCGDSIYPGEGTAGVTQSALIVSRQLMAQRGLQMNVPG